MERIEAQRDLKAVLARVEKPARYAGGEYGQVVKEGGRLLLRVAVSYPDLYEIGMSNLSIRLIYRILNNMEDVACERVFAPAPDFEAELRARGLPLYSLETATPLHRFDILGFSVGYELTLTNLLAILDLGGVAVLRQDRGSTGPIVVAGGPAVTNPIPFGPFVDAVFIGEIEERAQALFNALAGCKSQGAGRDAMLEVLRNDPAVWYPGKTERTARAIWRGFGAGLQGDSGMARPEAAPSLSEALAAPPFPVPSLQTVQDHGVVEIMRGCPHGCRFCHAGVFYRPFRLKDPTQVLREVEEQVYTCGYREVTLSSLSSGDYPGLVDMVRAFNQLFAKNRVSFSLPSLRVDSLTLGLLSELSTVRKSGLTFAVETPGEGGQAAINKEASYQRTLEILREARAAGWKKAKFYFMIGLPFAGGAGEEEAIIDWLLSMQEDTGMHLAVNLSAFIPKPHTPFQRAAQLPEAEALERIMAARRILTRRGIAVRYHSPFQAVLEGLFSRGDERAGTLALRAFRLGARLDAWEDRISQEIWRRVFQEAGWEVEKETCRPRGAEEPLPWDNVSLGVTRAFLRREIERAGRGERTGACRADCLEPCGVCGDSIKAGAPEAAFDSPAASPQAMLPRIPGSPARVLFSFAKQGKAVFLGHLSLMQVFERALARSGYLAVFSQGFNPTPRLEFAHPLSVGIASREEIAAVELESFDSTEEFRSRLNRALPQGLSLVKAKALPERRAGLKKISLMSIYWGSEYRVQGGPDSPAPGERLVQYKRGGFLKYLEAEMGRNPMEAGLEIERVRTFASVPEGGPISYFDYPFPDPKEAPRP